MTSKRKILPISLGAAALGLLGLSVGSARADTAILLPDLTCGPMHSEVVLFGFDSGAFPFQQGLETHLTAGTPSDVVLPPGPPGSYDEDVRFYGTVLRIDGKFRMWYWGTSGPELGTIGFGQGLHPHKAFCYATSDDGIHWKKPSLGLVDYHGSKANNIVLFPAKSPHPAAPILYDPEDPNPARCFKMVYEADFGREYPQFGVAFSPDGLRWTLSKLNPVGPFLEMSGIARFRGRYYVTGQDRPLAHQPIKARKLATFVSTDFEHWSPCAAMGLNRSPDLTNPSIEGLSNAFEEVHLGAALWNRGNVLLGFYGQWHGTPSGDRRQLTMDLGFAVSHDALHYVEPVPGFKMIASHEQPSSPPFAMPALMQGEGMENVGDQTYYWYSSWMGSSAVGVRLARWPRDRLGTLQPSYPAAERTAAPFSGAQAVSCAFRVSDGGKASMFLNASGLGPRTKLTVCLLDETFRPIPGYTAVIEQSGYRVPIIWQNQAEAGSDLGEIHVQIHFDGVRPEDAKVHALYIDPQSS